MYTKNHTQLTALEKLEDKFDDIIEDLNEKIVELEYTNDRQATEIGDLQSDARHLSDELDELNSLVTSLEDILDNLEIS
jgi:peptidoglycan hydrolase CwlO-like protein